MKNKLKEQQERESRRRFVEWTKTEAYKEWLRKVEQQNKKQGGKA